VVLHLPCSNTIKMGADYFGFSYLRNENKRNVTIYINNAADISVIVVYFLVVLAVGVWVSGQQFTSNNIFLPLTSKLLTLR